MSDSHRHDEAASCLRGSLAQPRFVMMYGVNRYVIDEDKVAANF